MGRHITPLDSATVSNPHRPFSGNFGQNQIRMYSKNGDFVVPAGVYQVRVRLFGAGSNGTYNDSGAGGGFAMKTIAVTPGETVTVTAGYTGSFGTHVSATAAALKTPGEGVGGDINYSGQSGQAPYAGGGGVANLFGDGVARGGAGNQTTGIPEAGISGPGSSGGDRFKNAPTGLLDSIDLIGCGGGGGGGNQNDEPGHGFNGGGGGGNNGNGGTGGFPGGGGGRSGNGARGLVIVEW